MYGSLLKSSMPRTQLKLVLILSVLVALVSFLSGVLVERGLRKRDTANTVHFLEAQALLVQEWVGPEPVQSQDAERLETIAIHAAKTLTSRITLMDREGLVLADSDVPRARIPDIENHSSRPEVANAIRGELGIASRLSDTVGRRLYYVAVPAVDETGFIVRIAVELPEIENGVRALRRELIVAGAWGLLAAVLLSFVITGITLRPLAEIRRVVSAISHGDLKGRLYVPKNSELGEISGAINVVAERLRNQVQEALAEKERLQAVLTGMAEGVLVLDLEDHVLLANPAFCHLFSLDETEFSGRPIMELVRSLELDELLKEIRETTSPISAEMNLIGSTVSRFLHLQAVGFPADGERVGTVVVFHDLTEIRRLERIRGDFVANASHELRTPLTAIRGFAETLLGNEVSAEEQRHYIEIIDRHSERLANLVNDLLELSKIEGGQLNQELASVNLAELARAAVRDYAPRFGEKNIHVEVVEEGDALAWADLQMTEQILTNLVDNALKYTENDGKIILTVGGEDAKRVSLAVRDNGVGIPAKDLDRIFERFYRVDRARSRALGGTGLGLSIVKHLAQGMDGELTVESILGEGSTFTLRLPRALG